MIICPYCASVFDAGDAEEVEVELPRPVVNVVGSALSATLVAEEPPEEET